MTQYRQGDVLIVAHAGELPWRARPVQPENGRTVLAHGEATGHAHAIKGDRVVLFREDGAGGGLAYLQAVTPVEVIHEEHAPLRLAPGRYAVLRQTQFDGRQSQRVRD
ncbi:MAG: hypothetical protein FJZ01_28095 [Candidatus Sericytochromatia bacterium]|nr:hypothetical protein [Candidatus Tanganyikabacteria bacterium]